MPMKRANKRWLDGDCPPGVLAIFDNGGTTWDRYTILYVPQPDSFVVDYLGASAHPFDPQGFGQHGTIRASEVAGYRYRETSAKHSARWSDLPDDVKRAVRQDLELTTV